MVYFIFAFTWYLITVAANWLECGKTIATILYVITLASAIIALVNFWTHFNPLSIALG